MAKKELIEKWESKEGAPSYEISAFPVNPSLNEMYIAGYGVARKEILDDLKQLDEPKKVVVPKFVAEWITICKNKNKDLSYAIHAPFLRDFLLERFGDDDSRVRWLQTNDNQNILARAWLDGYEVETKQLYYVVFDILHSQKYLVKNVKTNQFYLSNNEKVVGNYEQVKFTEQEIKAIDERYWPFAVKVDGE
ncbi:DUF1642 domain-containing protein [Enterococcus faecalis]|uniref:DUF1642 domain-containing protein n=1 Tax=Enterococcus faecalis TaxID=1351 RepID=UPI0040422D7B